MLQKKSALKEFMQKSRIIPMHTDSLIQNTTDVAFLDSGTGGIPYMLTLKEKIPAASCVYLGDTEHFPYGEKSAAEITECASLAIKKIIAVWNPATIVIACNTISVTALCELRNIFPALPIVGTVPAIKVGAAVSQNKRIGLLATNATVTHPYCRKLTEDFAKDCAVISRGDPELISFIEKSYFTADETARLAAVRPAADFFLENGCDTIILGCTHFTHIADEMRKLCGKAVTVVDSRDGVANQTIRCLSRKNGAPARTAEENGMQKTKRNYTFFVTRANESEISEYKLMCKRMHVPWGGII